MDYSAKQLVELSKDYEDGTYTTLPANPLEGVEFNGEVFTKNGEVIEEEIY